VLSSHENSVSTCSPTKFNMDDIEERPSKIRKISATDISESPAQTLPETSEPVKKTPHNPTNSHPQDENMSKTKRETPGEGGEAVEKQALSKSQLKKLRKKEQWEAGKDDRRLKRREKHKEKQARKASARAELAAQAAAGEVSPSSLNPDLPINGQGKPKGRGPARPIQVPMALILDCDFNDMMTEKELISLGAQLTRCYSENRTAVYRSHLAISSWGGALRERFEGPLAKNHLGWKGVRFIEGNFAAAAKELDLVMWGPDGGKLVGALKGGEVEDEINGPAFVPKPTNGKPTAAKGNESVKPLEAAQKSTVLEPAGPVSEANARRTEPDVTPALQATPESNGAKPSTATAEPEQSAPQEAFSTIRPPPSIVYLTSDSPHTLSHLSPNTTYIVGGIVDKNRHKGLCYKRARSLGIPTAKLPIGEYMTMQSRSVLAVNHVVEIMLRWLETGDWGEAFLRVIPKRKEAKLRVKEGEGRDEEGEGEGGGEGEGEGDSESEDDPQAS
jgi:tRNA (guanine9-N1)-methyltransferase